MAATRENWNRKKGAGRHHPSEVRAAVMSALLQGAGVAETAREYRLPPSTVSRWKKAAREAAGRTEEVGDLLLRYLRSGLETVTAQHETMQDPQWCREQGAAELATCHGILVDKLMRLLEALDPAELGGG